MAFGTKSDDEIQYLTDLSCLAHEVREQTKVLLFVPLPDHPVGSKLHEATGHQR